MPIKKATFHRRNKRCKVALKQFKLLRKRAISSVLWMCGLQPADALFR